MSRIKRIIDLYLGHRQTRAVREEFAEWFDSPVDGILKQQSMQAYWDALEPPPVSPSQTRRAYAETTERIRRRNFVQGRPRPLWVRIARVAAMLAAPVAAAALTYLVVSQHLVPKTEWQEVYAPYGQTRNIALSDGSTITINSGSRLIYPVRFSGDERRVFLSGEAYADIAKDPDRGFVLSADDVDIFVHGTSFNICSYADNSEVEVALLSGVIDMQTKNLEWNRRIRMTPGELTKLDKSSGEITSMRFPDGLYSDNMEGNSLTFINSRLSDIALQLERTFNVRIVIDDERLADERYYSAFINHESLDQILAALQLNGRMRHRHVGNTIHLYR